MNVKELADLINKMIQDGELDPSTSVVRPFCMCDEEYGYVEAHFLDLVERKYEADKENNKRYEYGNVVPNNNSEITAKLG